MHEMFSVVSSNEEEMIMCNNKNGTHLFTIFNDRTCWRFPFISFGGLLVP